MELIRLSAANSALNFIDAADGSSHSFEEITNAEFPVAPKENALALLFLDNNLDSLTAFFSLYKSGYVLALFSSQIDVDLKENLITSYGPSLIFDASGAVFNGYSTFGNGAHRAEVIIPVETHKNIKVLLSTSGTTGSPKLVKLSEQNLVQNALSIIDYLPINPNDVTPLNLPIYYSYGLSVLTTHCIAGGSIVYNCKDMLQKEFWVDFEKFGFTSFAGVPYNYEMLNRIGFTKKAYPSLKYFTQAGGKLSEALVEKFGAYAKENACQFFVMYGQTEATARMSYLPPEHLMQKIGSMGKPIKNGHFDIIDDELCYSGPNVFGGYAEQAGDLNIWEHIELLHTGDLARVDSDGFYYITGRLKRFVKLFGNRINLDDVERNLNQHFAPLTFLVTGVEDKQMLIIKRVENIDDNALKQHIVDHYKIHISVMRCLYLADIPLTTNGKPDYKAINDIAIA